MRVSCQKITPKIVSFEKINTITIILPMCILILSRFLKQKSQSGRELTNINLFLTVLESEKFKIKALADLVCVKDQLPVLLSSHCALPPQKSELHNSPPSSPSSPPLSSSPYVAQALLELTFPLPLSSEHWDYRPALPRRPYSFHLLLRG